MGRGALLKFLPCQFDGVVQLGLQQLGANPTTDLPIKLSEFSIDSQSHALTGGVDQLTYISDQGLGQ